MKFHYILFIFGVALLLYGYCSQPNKANDILEVRNPYPIGVCYVENLENHKVIVFDSTGKVLCVYYHNTDSCKK